jgi:hypothetical protein
VNQVNQVNQVTRVTRVTRVTQMSNLVKIIPLSIGFISGFWMLQSMPVYSLLSQWIQATPPPPPLWNPDQVNVFSGTDFL